MANEWRDHVKKTMADMKSKAKDGKVMLKDVLKHAKKTYKKAPAAAAKKSVGGKKHKKRTMKKRKTKSKSKSKARKHKK